MTDKVCWIGVDQSTQGTKALLLDERGRLVCRCDVPHEQIVNDMGWVSHDPEALYANTLKACADLLKRSGVNPAAVAGLSVSNQRETSIIWDRASGKPLDYAVVWQCARGREITRRPEIIVRSADILDKTGIPLSPYFPAAKIAWLLQRHPETAQRSRMDQLCAGTVDSYLIFRLTGGRVFATDYSNASRTQLFDIFSLRWDETICEAFGIPVGCLPQVRASDDCFGSTDLEGLLPRAVPICGVLGDSHAALFGQGCLERGQMKVTYGTGSSVMMNVGPVPARSRNGLVTSIGWKRKGTVDYVLEANLNYTGAVIRWLERDVGLIQSAGETQALAEAANPGDQTYLVPAFSGLGAPYWASDVRAMLCGMDRATGRAEIVKAGLESIAYQIADVVLAMGKDMGASVQRIRADGGATKNRYLMQFQSDISGLPVDVSNTEELSGVGAACMGGIALGIYNEATIRADQRYMQYAPSSDRARFDEKYAGWLRAVGMLTGK